MTETLNIPLNQFGKDPFALFDAWFQEAQKAEINDPNAMTLATVNEQGRPAARIVLLKAFGPDGFDFFTNALSRKGKDIAHHPFAALCFHWKSLLRQIRIEGRVETLDDGMSDAYFATRHRSSQIGAWASLQSEELQGMAALEERVKHYEKEFENRKVPRPPHWKGYRLKPDLFEFWQQRDYRLHERVSFALQNDDGWRIKRLYP